MISRRRLGSVVTSGLAMPFVRASAATPRRLRLATDVSADTSIGAAATAMAELVASGSGGRLRVEIYPNATLGNEEASLKAAASGALDLAIVSSGLLSPYVPEVGLLDIPFVFDSPARARAALDGPEGAALADAAAPYGLAVLAWGENGVRHLTGHRPLRSVEDLRGLKLRVLPSPLLVAAFRSMGADAESIPFSQLYEALLTGQFEAEENPLQLILSSRFYEVQSHLTLTAHTYAAAPIIASADLLDDLSEADRRLLATAAQQAAQRSRAFSTLADERMAAILQDKGMTVITDPDRDSMRAAAAPAEAAAAARFGADRIARLRGA